MLLRPINLANKVLQVKTLDKPLVFCRPLAHEVLVVHPNLRDVVEDEGGRENVSKQEVRG